MNTCWKKRALRSKRGSRIEEDGTDEDEEADLLTEDLGREWYLSWDGRYGDIQLANRCPTCGGETNEDLSEPCPICKGYGWLLTDAGVVHRQKCRQYKQGYRCPHHHKNLNKLICPHLIRLAALGD